MGDPKGQDETLKYTEAEIGHTLNPLEIKSLGFVLTNIFGI